MPHVAENLFSVFAENWRRAANGDKDISTIALPGVSLDTGNRWVRGLLSLHPEPVLTRHDFVRTGPAVGLSNTAISTPLCFETVRMKPGHHCHGPDSVGGSQRCVS